MTLPSAEILLPTRGRFDLRRVVLADAGPPPSWTWRDGSRTVLRRAEAAADGRVYLLAIRAMVGGAVLRVTGRDAPEAEILAPFAARVRRALGLDAAPGPHATLRGTSLFEDVVTAICGGDDGAEWRPLSILLRLGRRCPAAPRLRTFPTPSAIARAGIVRLRVAGLGTKAAPVVALARSVARGDCDLVRLEARAPGRTTPALLRTLRRIPGVDAAAARRLLRSFGRSTTGVGRLRTPSERRASRACRS